MLRRRVRIVAIEPHRTHMPGGAISAIADGMSIATIPGAPVLQNDRGGVAPEEGPRVPKDRRQLSEGDGNVGGQELGQVLKNGWLHHTTTRDRRLCDPRRTSPDGLHADCAVTVQRLCGDCAATDCTESATRTALHPAAAAGAAHHRWVAGARADHHRVRRARPLHHRRQAALHSACGIAQVLTPDWPCTSPLPTAVLADC